MAEPIQGEFEEKAAVASEALRQSEVRYQLLIESVTDYAIFMLDPTGQVLSWNRGAERYKGYRAEEIIGRSYENFYTEEDRAAGRPGKLLARALADGHVEDEGWRVRKDGTRFWADVVITPMYDQSGTLVGFSKVTRDLTERKLAEDQRRQFELLIKNVTDYAIVMLSPQGNVVSWNKGAETLKGYSEAEIIGMPYETFFLPEDAASGKPRRLLEAARKFGHIEDEGWRRKKDGSRFWALAVITAVYDERGTFVGYGKVTRDLTDRKRMEELKAEKAEIQATSTLKSEFLAKMSHELRTPLNSIIGYTELVSTDPQLPMDDLNRDNLQAVLRNARHLLTLINEVLDLSKIEAGQTTLKLGAFDPRQAIETAIAVSRPMADRKGLVLGLHVEPGVACVVSDELKLRQIVVNLVENAVKFTNEGAVHVTLAPSGPDRFTVTVKDTGIGVAPEHHDLIFQEFRQVDTGYARERGGTGLGLAISRRLAELMGGSLTIESTLGEGASFTLELPREAAPTPEEVQ